VGCAGLIFNITDSKGQIKCMTDQIPQSFDLPITLLECESSEVFPTP